MKNRNTIGIDLGLNERHHIAIIGGKWYSVFSYKTKNGPRVFRANERIANEEAARKMFSNIFNQWHDMGAKIIQ